MKHILVLFQVTKGGALTLVSLWKSQFDDSEETTDNEWKQEQLQVRVLYVCRVASLHARSHFVCNKSIVSNQARSCQFYHSTSCLRDPYIYGPSSRVTITSVKELELKHDIYIAFL